MTDLKEVDNNLDAIVGQLRIGNRAMVPAVFAALERGANYLLRRLAGDGPSNFEIVNSILAKAAELALAGEFENGRELSGYVVASIRAEAPRLAYRVTPVRAEDPDRMERMSSIINRLSERDRDIVYSHYAEGKSVEAIGFKLKMGGEEVKDVLSRLRKTCGVERRGGNFRARAAGQV